MLGNPAHSARSGSVHDPDVQPQAKVVVGSAFPKPSLILEEVLVVRVGKVPVTERVWKVADEFSMSLIVLVGKFDGEHADFLGAASRKIIDSRKADEEQ